MLSGPQVRQSSDPSHDLKSIMEMISAMLACVNIAEDHSDRAALAFCILIEALNCELLDVADRYMQAHMPVYVDGRIAALNLVVARMHMLSEQLNASILSRCLGFMHSQQLGQKHLA